MYGVLGNGGTFPTDGFVTVHSNASTATCEFQDALEVNSHRSEMHFLLGVAK